MQLSAVQYDGSGNFNFLYNYFYTENYTGVESTSSYALPITPFYFKTALDGIENFISRKRIVWDFGDGTKSEAVTAQHSYKIPGEYKVTCYLYDENGDSYYDIYNSRVTVLDYVPDLITLSAANPIEHLTGEIKNPVVISRFNSARTIEKSNLPTIFGFISGANAYDYFSNGLQDMAYGHLLPYSSFYQQLTSNDVVETLPVSSINTIDSEIYVKLQNNELVHTSATDPDAVFAGLTGAADVYFASDFPGNYELLFGYAQGSIFDYTNTTTYGVSAKIDQNTSYNHLTITSNGIDGEGTVLSSFNINKNKFAGVKTAFVIKVKDENNFSQKSMPTIGSDIDLVIALIDAKGSTVYDASFYSDFGSLSASGSGGFYKGYFTCDTDVLLTDVVIGAYIIYEGRTIGGLSNKFNIYPDKYYTPAKKGEDIDFRDVFKTVAKQPLFNDAKVLMDDFLGTIFGDIDSAQTSIGKSTYEKIQNFTDNNSVIDYANIDQLASIFRSIDLPPLTRYNMPPNIKKLVDLLSISHSKLFGSRNVYGEDFDTKGYVNSDFYGLNLGEELSRNSIINKNEDIVALEKYSGTYTKLNTQLPLSAVYSVNVLSASNIEVPLTTDICSLDILTESGENILVSDEGYELTDFYPLSDYNETWGWPLLIGGGRDVFDVYSFYKIEPVTDGTITNSKLNFEDTNNTIPFDTTSYSEWSQEDGVISNILANALYEGLDLL